MAAPGTLEAMVQAMESTLGAHETNGNNTNYITSWYGLNGEPWCNMTITYAAYHSGNAQNVCFGQKFAYTVAHAQEFKDHGLWHPMTNGVVGSGIRRGDVIFFDWSGGSSIGSIDHVGLVTGVSGSTVLTIEGNFENRCGRFARNVSVIAGFGRPHYAASSTPSPTPVPTPTAHYEPFPGASFFSDGRRSPIIAAMHNRLVAEGCNRYESSVNKDVWGSGDKASYAAFQRKCGFYGDDANGVPGKSSWDKLRVPNV